ncbi:MAG: tyrosine-type recombinase/integrase [Agathobacter sp.]|nr:tyrosine-type recombinase/integrase [Agathobacter sp.]
MTENTLPFHGLMEQVLIQLKDQGYMDSTITVYHRFYNRVNSYLNQMNTDIYTKAIGDSFLSTLNVSDTTFVSYKCAIRRLNDYLDGLPYRCHHGNPCDCVVDIYASVLDEYLKYCKGINNKPATIHAKEKSCVIFLNCLESHGCSTLSVLSPELVSQALLRFDNKDNYALIRLFLKYLFEEGHIKSDFSSIVPRYKRKQVLPTIYSPEEIRKIEYSIDTESITGKRNLAIIRLATRMGLRSGDIAKLKWSEIDFSTGYISIIQEKTSNPWMMQMPQEVYESLFNYKREDQSHRNDDYVFHSLSAPYGRITTSIIRHAVTDSFVAAGIDITEKKHGPHTFRASLASSMVNEGTSYDTVKRILGHSDPDMIKHYARTDIENLRMYAIEPPLPTGLFSDYLTGKKVLSLV